MENFAFLIIIIFFIIIVIIGVSSNGISNYEKIRNKEDKPREVKEYEDEITNKKK